MNISKLNLNTIKNKSQIYIFNDYNNNDLIYNNSNEIKLLINHITKLRGLDYSIIIDENNFEILDSIIKLEKKNNHNKSYILFKNYNTFLNNINNKKSIKNHLNELLNNNYNIKIFLINNLNLNFKNDDYIFIRSKNYEYLIEHFDINIKNINNYEYIVIHNNNFYYFNLNNNKKRNNIEMHIIKINSSENKKIKVTKKRDSSIFEENDSIEFNMKKLKINNNNNLKDVNLINKKRNIDENNIRQKKLKYN
jgi:hypothetical protein